MPRVVSTFPPPPPYYTSYGSEETMMDPPKPIEGEYMVFNTLYDTNMTSHPPSCQLFNPNEEIKTELKKLCGVMINQFLVTLDTLVQNPSRAGVKIRELQLITENIHYLLNQCRPHQAREVLLLIMELNNQVRKENIESLQAEKQKLKQLLDKISNLVEDTSSLFESDMDMDDANDDSNKFTDELNAMEALLERITE